MLDNSLNILPAIKHLRPDGRLLPERISRTEDAEAGRAFRDKNLRERGQAQRRKGARDAGVGR